MNYKKPVEDLNLEELLNELHNLAYQHGVSRTGSICEAAANKLYAYSMTDKIKEPI